MSKVVEQIDTVLAEDLPPGWSLATIEDLVGVDGVFVDGDWVESKDQDPTGEVRLIQLADIGDGVYRNKSDRFLTHEKALELGCTFLRRDDVLIARMPDPLGRACIFPGDPKKSVTVVDVAIVRSSNGEFNHRWLMYFINAPVFRAVMASLQSGSTRKRISRGNLTRITLPVPPREQQNRIVSDIEKQFSRLVEAVANLKRIKANLKRYKASVLKAAVEGKLTEDWRKHHPNVEPASKLLERILAEGRAKWAGRGKYKEPAAPDTNELPSLPRGWAWATIHQVAHPERYSITDGPFGSNLKTEHYKETGPRVIRLQNIGEGVFANEEAHISENHFARLQKHRIFAGDLVIAALGENPPRSCLIPQSVGHAIVKADCVRFKPHKDAVARYLNIVLNSEPTRQRAKNIVHGVGRPRLNLGEIKAIVVPVPPTVEQQAIVAEVERRLSVIEALESAVEANLTRAARLRQSILSTAFSGRLAVSESEIARRENKLIAY